jgi:hypothetical protein
LPQLLLRPRRLLQLLKFRLLQLLLLLILIFLPAQLKLIHSILGSPCCCPRRASCTALEPLLHCMWGAVEIPQVLIGVPKHLPLLHGLLLLCW